jgi:hypothetical protein
MSASYTGNPAAVDSPSPAPNLSGNYPQAALPADGDALTAASVGQEARLGPNWLAYLVERFRDQVFGDGGDGVLNITSGGNLSAMKFYSTVSVTNGAFYTNGWPIIARQSITLSGSSVISGAGGGGSGVQRGINITGAIGADGPHMHISPTSALATAPQYIGQYICGLGGAGGNGGGTATGTNPVRSPGSSYRVYPYRFHAGGTGLGTAPITNGPSSGLQYDTIRGGAAGNPGDPIAGVGGGGAGAGGALVILMAPTITLGANLNAAGGAGGTGVGTNTNGGGGGGGGAFLFICQTLNTTGAAYFAAGGSGGAATGTGTAGTAGGVGNSTPYIVYVP